MKRRSAAAAAAVALALLVLMLPMAAPALPLEVVYDDAPGEGFFDPQLGAQRQAALSAAVAQWASTLAGDIPVIIVANMPRLGGTGADALLASAGSVTVHRNFTGAPLADTWYAAAFANQRVGMDVNGETLAEIQISFNADVDEPDVLGSVRWYYGGDARPGADIDFVTIALHEIGHGLGFFDTIDGASGTFALDGDPSALERLLLRPEIGALATLRPAERRAAVRAPGDLWWNGPAVVAFHGSPRGVYAPEVFQDGSSVAHFDADAPAELMAPFYAGATHDFGALLPALADIGWQLAGPTPTPRGPPATPTATRPARPSPTPRTPRATRELVYASNFDGDSVSVIDRETRALARTIPLGDGPLGLAAAPDGKRIYVGEFFAGTLAVLRTGDDHIVARVPVGGAPNGVAVSSDGTRIAVADTAGEQVVIVAADTLAVLARVPAGVQPSAIALDAAGRQAFVTNFGGRMVTMVDLDAQKRRGLLPFPFANTNTGLVGIALAPGNGRGYVNDAYNSQARELSGSALALGAVVQPFFSTAALHEAVVTNAAGTFAWFSGRAADSGAGSVALVDMADNRPQAVIPVGLMPEALALSPDEGVLYCANTGSDTVTFIDTALRRAFATVRVGAAPMGVVAVAVPEGQCPDECQEPTATATATPTTRPIACTGDCDGDGVVGIAELITAVAIASGSQPVAACPAADRDGDGAVVIAELVAAVASALNGCAQISR